MTTRGIGRRSRQEITAQRRSIRRLGLPFRVSNPEVQDDTDLADLIFGLVSAIESQRILGLPREDLTRELCLAGHDPDAALSRICDAAGLDREALMERLAHLQEPGEDESQVENR